MLHIYTLCGIFLLANIDTDTTGSQFKSHPNDIQLGFADEGSEKCWVPPLWDQTQNFQHSWGLT